MEFQPSKSYSSLFIRQSGTEPVSILLYGDDLVIAGADLEEIGRVKSQLTAPFEMKDLGDLHYFLGIEVIRTPEGILISQRCRAFRRQIVCVSQVETARVLD